VDQAELVWGNCIIERHLTIQGKTSENSEARLPF